MHVAKIFSGYNPDSTHKVSRCKRGHPKSVNIFNIIYSHHLSTLDTKIETFETLTQSVFTLSEISRT